MNLSKNALFCLKIRLGIVLFVFSVLLFGCSTSKNNTETIDKETQSLPYSSQGNESKKHKNSKNKMVPAVMTGDGKLQLLDNYQGGNFYAFKVDVEERYFSENIAVPISVTMAKNIDIPYTPVVLQGKIIAFLNENVFPDEDIYLFEDNTGTMVIKTNKNLSEYILAGKTQMIEIIGRIVLKSPQNEIDVGSVRRIKD